MLRIRTPTERPQPGIAARTFFNCTTELLKLAARKATNGPASAGVDSPWCDNPPRWERQDASAFSSSVQRAVIRRRAEMLRVRGASQRVRRGTADANIVVGNRGGVVMKGVKVCRFGRASIWY
jgi:hypothetical protein